MKQNFPGQNIQNKKEISFNNKKITSIFVFLILSQNIQSKNDPLCILIFLCFLVVISDAKEDSSQKNYQSKKEEDQTVMPEISQ